MAQSVAAQQHVNALVQMFGCSHEAAHRAVARHWPDTRGSMEELQRKQRPCLIALEVFALQRDYMRSLRDTMLPIEKTQLPFFREEYCNEPCDGYPTLTWSEIAQCINNGPTTEVFFVDGDPGIASNINAYEEYYQNKIVMEGFKDIIGFISAVDGLVPLVDYLHVRHFAGLDPLQSQPYHRYQQPSPALDGRWCSTMFPPECMRGRDVAAAQLRGDSCRGVHRRRILFGNDIHTSINPRQDKASMQLALRDHGLAYIRGISGYDVNAMRQWRMEQKISFPVIVKPVSGAGSEFVTLCRSEEDIQAAFAVSNDAKTMQLTDASHMLLQEYIEGQEYVVNVVSYKGRHVVSDLWKSWKCPFDVFSSRLRPSIEEKFTRAFYNLCRDKLPVRLNTTVLLYDRLEFIHNLADLPEGSEERRVVAYTLQCIDALGMRQGCSHCEVRIDDRIGSSTRGMPILIELNARMLGDIPRTTSLVGYNQYTLMMYLVLCAVSIPEDALLRQGANASDMGEEEEEEEEECRSRLPWPPAPLLYRSLTTGVTRHVVFLRVAEDSYICAAGVRAIQRLLTFHRLSRDTTFDELKPGTLLRLHKTVDLLTSPGACVMEGSEMDIHRDTAYIRRVENKDLSEWNKLLDTALVAASECHKGLAGAAVDVHADLLGVSRSDPSMLAIKLKSARENVEKFFERMEEPPLFIPVEYVDKLRRLGASHLVSYT